MVVTPYYEDAAVTLYLGDCLEVMRELPSVAHAIFDPPYDTEAHTKGRRIKTTGGGSHYGTVGGCVIDFDPISAETRKAAAFNVARLTRRWALVFCQVEAVGVWRYDLEKAGLVYRRACAWLKRDAQPQLSGDRPGMGYESIVCAHKPGRSRWNGGGKRGVYETSRASTCEGRPALHMTEKPLPLMAQLVADFTDEGETILDPFAGSGTTGVAAKLNGRKCILIEKSEAYCEVAAKRLRETHPGELFANLKRAKPQSLLEKL